MHDRVKVGYTKYYTVLIRLYLFRYSSTTKDVLKSLYNDRKIDCDLVVNLIRHISLEKNPGAILVFVPGWDDISMLEDKLKQQLLFKSEAFLILPLHGSMMSMEDQQKVFNHPPEGVRKIVISTNVAETRLVKPN
jgi:HrpA-like RNA helicase